MLLRKVDGMPRKDDSCSRTSGIVPIWSFRRATATTCLEDDEG